MTESVPADAPVFPLRRECPFAPPEGYEQLREQAPVSRVSMDGGIQGWAVTRHADVRAMLADTRFSSDRQNPNFPVPARNRLRRTSNPSLIGLDPPEHGSARKAVVGEFTVKRMRALQPRIQQIVDDHIDTMLAGPRPVDLVHALALPVPSLVICELLGVPYAHHEFFQVRSGKLINREIEPEARQIAVDELRDYLDELVTAKEADPGDDLLGRQIVKQRQDAAADHEALVSLAFLLLIAGHETTANMISLGTLALLRHPEQLERIRTDPDRTPAAVEELLRYFTIADSVTTRVTVSDVELGGVHIPAGEGVMALSNAANHDPEVFPDPDRFDVDRVARNHVAFGFGPHQCLGQNLARLELQIVFDTLFARLPGLRLAESVDDLPFKHDAAIFGLHRLPVTW